MGCGTLGYGKQGSRHGGGSANPVSVEPASRLCFLMGPRPSEGREITALGCGS